MTSAVRALASLLVARPYPPDRILISILLAIFNTGSYMPYTVYIPVLEYRYALDAENRAV